MRLGKKAAGPIMVYVVPESDKHRADEFIERAHAGRLSLRTARELEIDALRKQYPLFPAELALKVNHRYGLLEISEGSFAWRNGKQVPNSTEINLIAYTYCEDKVLRCDTAWGGIHECRVKHGMVLFELTASMDLANRFIRPVTVRYDEDHAVECKTFRAYCSAMMWPDPTYVKMSDETEKLVTRLFNERRIKLFDALETYHDSGYQYDDIGREFIQLPEPARVLELLRKKYHSLADVTV